MEQAQTARSHDEAGQQPGSYSGHNGETRQPPERPSLAGALNRHNQIKLRKEKQISLMAATKFLPGQPCRATIVRWATKGLRGVRLEAFAVGRNFFTSEEACERFIVRCTQQAGLQDEAPADPTAEVDAVGVGEKGE